jgi:molecular chaperone Hsp33
LWLAANDKTCTGFLLQELPDTSNQASDLNENTNNWEHSVHLASTLGKNELLSLSTREILHRLFHEDDIRLFEPAPLSFKCGCSTERINKVIVSLGLDEARSIISEQGNIQVDCEFCNAQYIYSLTDIEQLFAKNIHSTTTHH